MHRRSNRLKGLVVIIASMLLAVTVCGVFYYFKIKQNENYQNQLHFRELDNISKSINNGIGQLTNLASLRNTSFDPKNEFNKLRNGLLATVDNYHKELSLKNEELSSKKNSLSEINNYRNITNDSKKELTRSNLYIDYDENEEEIYKLQSKLKRLEEQLFNIEEKYHQRAYELITPIFNKNEFTDQLSKECDNQAKSCVWLGNAIDALMDLMDNVGLNYNDYIEDESLITKTFGDIEASIKREYEQAEQFILEEGKKQIKEYDQVQKNTRFRTYPELKQNTFKLIYTNLLKNIPIFESDLNRAVNQITDLDVYSESIIALNIKNESINNQINQTFNDSDTDKKMLQEKKLLTEESIKNISQENINKKQIVLRTIKDKIFELTSQTSLQVKSDLHKFENCLIKAVSAYQDCSSELVDLSKLTDLTDSGTALKRLKLDKYPEQTINSFLIENTGSKHVFYNYESQSFEVYLKEKIVAEAPAGDFLGESSKRFPLTLLVDSKGTNIASSENIKINASLVGLSFQQVDKILEELFKNQIPNYKQGEEKLIADTDLMQSNIPGYSGFIDTIISGVSYRLYISPITVERLKIANVEEGKAGQLLFLIGFREKSQLTSAKLSISRSLILFAILVFIGLVALIPLIKIRLVSIRQSFSIWDRHFAVIGLLLLVSVITIGIFDWAYYTQIKSQINKQNRSIFIQVRNRFNDEVSTLLKFANNVLTEQNQIKNEYNDFIFKEKDPHINNYFLENLFYLTGEKELAKSAKLDEIAYWSTKKSERNYNNISKSDANKDISLLSREYVTRALKNDLWPVKLNDIMGELPDSNKALADQCNNGLYIQRLFNLRDGRLSTQFSQSCRGNNKLADEYNDVLSFGTKLQTFFQPILPANFGFVVFDNESGKALYHSDDKNRSLVENVFAATDNNRLIESMVNTPYHYNQPINFDAIYNGKMHNFSIGALKQGIPWSLAVFYDKEEVRSINLIATFVSLSICIILIFTLYLLFILLIPRSVRRHFFWPQAGNDGLRKVGKLTVVYSIPLIIIIVFAICFNVFTHHYMRYQKIVNAELAHRIHYSAVEQNKYRELIIDDASTFKRTVGDSPVCYLGIHSKNSMNDVPNSKTCNIKEKSLSMDKEAYGGNHYPWFIIESLWDYIDLRTDIDDALILTKHLNGVSKKIDVTKNHVDNNFNLFEFNRDRKSKLLFPQDDNFSNTAIIVYFLLIVLMSFLSLAVFYIIIKHWIFERLVGSNLASHFRQKEKFQCRLEDLSKDNYFEHNRFVQIIRPRATPQSAISTFPLISKKITCVSSFYESLLKPDEAVSSFFTSCNVELPLINKQTLLLNGLEDVANDSNKRSYVLDVIEHLMTIDNLSIILLCEVAPLYRLTQQEQYPSRGSDISPASLSEVIRWSDVLRKFNKVYDWSAKAKSREHSYSIRNKVWRFISHKLNNKSEQINSVDHSKAVETLLYESNGWPELESTLRQFWQYTKRVNAGCETEINTLLAVKSGPDIITLKRGKVLDDYLTNNWQPEQIVEFFGANAGAFYRFRWELCTRNERLLMYQIANGFEPNPGNREPLEHLTRRGYIFRDKGWHIINNSFKNFILSAEPDEVFELWVEDANESVWRYLRIPFFAFLIALLAIMAFSATDAIESALGILTAVFALIPMAMRNISLFKSD